MLLLQLSWSLPDLVQHRVPADGLAVKMMSGNVEYTNTKVAGLAHQIERAGADLVVLQEVSVANLDALVQSNALTGLTYSMLKPFGGFGTAVWCRWPLIDLHVTTIDGVPTFSFVVQTPAGNLDVIDVHTLPPQNPSAWKTWRAELTWIGTQVSQHPHRLAVVGDFNATADLASFRDLLRHGLVDAHRAAGGWSPTWPTNRWWAPPLFRFDHVLVTNDIEVMWQHVGWAYGSDHLPLSTELVLPR